MTVSCSSHEFPFHWFPQRKITQIRHFHNLRWCSNPSLSAFEKHRGYDEKRVSTVFSYAVDFQFRKRKYASCALFSGKSYTKPYTKPHREGKKEPVEIPHKTVDRSPAGLRSFITWLGYHHEIKLRPPTVFQIIQTGTIRFCALIADSSGRIQIIAPVPRGTLPLSRTSNARTNESDGLTERLISSGCSSPSLSITMSISLASLSR